MMEPPRGEVKYKKWIGPIPLLPPVESVYISGDVFVCFFFFFFFKAGQGFTLQS